MDKNQHILITGTHRSGTTWIGKTLDINRSVEYVGEPFNVGKHNPYIDHQFERWFAYVPEMEREEKEKTYKAFKQLFEKRATATRRYRRMTTDHQGKITLQHYLKFAGLALLRNRVLMKDPIALRSAGWLADHFNMKVICTVRHPLRFVSSLKKWKLDFDFNHLLYKGQLKDKRLKPYEDEILHFSKNEQNQNQDIVSQACLLWNLLNTLIWHYKESRPDWYFIRFEDLSKEPVFYFKKLYDFADLIYSKKVERQILAHTRTGGKSMPDQKFSARNSKQNLETWKVRLSEAESEKVLQECSQLLHYFYPDQEL